LQYIPESYYNFENVFFKKQSNILPLYCKYNYYIELEASNNLGVFPIYKMTIEELLVIKTYILNNFHKGFIKYSQASFATPILFVKKPDNSLRFYIDFCKLNDLICKDHYSLLLIDKTFAHLNTVKIFTKLNIHQAFYYIRINKQSKKLTTFRTRYNTYKYKILLFGLINSPTIY